MSKFDNINPSNPQGNKSHVHSKSIIAKRHFPQHESSHYLFSDLIWIWGLVKFFRMIIS